MAASAPASRVLEEVSPAHSRSPGSGQARPGPGRALWSLDRAEQLGGRCSVSTDSRRPRGSWALGQGLLAWPEWGLPTASTPREPDLLQSRVPARCQAWPRPAMHKAALPRPFAHPPVRPPTHSFNKHSLRITMCQESKTRSPLFQASLNLLCERDQKMREEPSQVRGYCHEGKETGLGGTVPSELRRLVFRQAVLRAFTPSTRWAPVSPTGQSR